MINPAQEIRNELKKRGINSRRVSVRCSHSSLDIRIKDLSVCAEEISKIAKQFERVDRCQYSGEILAGGNFFVSVCYSFDAGKEAEQTDLYKEILTEVKSALEPLKDDGGGVELRGGAWAFLRNNGVGYQTTLPWTDNYWDLFWRAEELALEIYRATVQGKLKNNPKGF